MPDNCGPAAVNCTSEIPYTIGTGTTNQTNYPTPFMSYWGDGRLQVLYSPAELHAMGFIGGKISSIMFDVLQKNSVNPFTDFTVKIGCTSLTQYPATGYSFATGITII